MREALVPREVRDHREQPGHRVFKEPREIKEHRAHRA